MEKILAKPSHIRTLVRHKFESERPLASAAVGTSMLLDVIYYIRQIIHPSSASTWPRGPRSHARTHSDRTSRALCHSVRRRRRRLRRRRGRTDTHAQSATRTFAPSCHDLHVPRAYARLFVPGHFEEISKTFYLVGGRVCLISLCHFCRTVDRLWSITEDLNILYKENWTRLAAHEVQQFQVRNFK